ncbi:MAG: HlyD family efflux transporter periplasmic adaptor subunit [Halieaceae bacterium]|nr:HlyD family efflux transporter periplasmic adaptor subunit [Halieaceae bacterium]
MALFRKEAVARQVDRLYGDVLVAPKMSSAAICLVLFVWLVSAAVFLARASFARSESVSGWLEPDAGIVRVFAHKGGRIARVLVREGDAVVKNQPLAVVTGDRVLADGQRLEDVLLGEYVSQRRVMEHSLARIAARAEEKRRIIASNRQHAEKQLRWVDAQLDTLAARIDLFRNRRDAQEQLNRKDLVADAAIDHLREQELELENNFQSISARRVSLLNQIAQSHSSLAMLDQDVADETAALNLKLSNLSQATAKLRGERSYVVTASIPGVVSGLNAIEGQLSTMDRQLMSIVPESSRMTARLLVPPRSSGFVQPGQRVRLRYDAFPHQKFGLHGGTIVDVARNISLGHELADAPVPVREPAYQVSAVLNDDAVFAYGERHALRPGMTLSADITLEERSVLEWLLDPLLSLRGRI